MPKYAGKQVSITYKLEGRQAIETLWEWPDIVIFNWQSIINMLKELKENHD